MGVVYMRSLSIVLTCPKCRSELVATQVSYFNGGDVILSYTGYCPSLKCRVRKVTFDRNYRVVGYRSYKTLETKRRTLYRILKNKYPSSRPMYRRKVIKRYLKLKSEFE